MKNPYFHALLADPKPYLKGNTEDPISLVEGAYTWFGRPNWAYSGVANKWFFGCIVSGRGYVIEHDLTTGKFTPTPVGELIENDDHNQAQILIRSSDKRLIAFYAGHNSPEIRYRISTNPLDAKSWQDEVIISEPYLKSYVSPYQASNGNIFIFYRARHDGTNGWTTQWHYKKSTDGGFTWGAPVPFYERDKSQNLIYWTVYLISCQDGDKLHFCATPGNPDEANEYDLNVYHFYFDMVNETLHKTDGTAVTGTADINNMSQVYQVATEQQSWILDITTKNGQPRILFAFFPKGRPGNVTAEEGKDRRLWLAEWNGITWESREICQTQIGYIGSELNVDQHYYTGVSRFCQSNPDILFVPRKIEYRPENVLELWKHDLRTGNWQQLTFNSVADNWRPVSIPAPTNNLVWMQNLNYYDFTDFRILLRTLTVDVT